MSDFERDLSEWLHRAAPPAPRALTMDDVLSEPSRVIELGSRKRWTPLLAAAVAVVLVAVIAVALSQGSTRHAAPAVHTTGVTPTPTSVSATAGPPSDFASTRVIGSQDATAWVLTDTLYVSNDAGTHWHAATLPHGVAASDVTLLDVSPDQTIWLATVHGSAIDLYHRARTTTSWTHIQLVAQNNNPNLTQPVGVFSFETHGTLVAMTAGWGVNPARDYSDLFLSTDSGATFTQRPTNLDQLISSTTFLDDSTALMVAGPDHNLLYRTTDAGTHWSRVPIPGTNNTSVLGTPTVTDTGVVLPVIADLPNNTQTATLEISTDNGASFHPSGTALHPASGIDFGDGITAIHGNNAWIAATGRIYQTTDLGHTWNYVTTRQTFVMLTLANNTTAIAQAGADCATDLPNGCTLTNYLIGTTNGGHSWQPFQLP